MIIEAIKDYISTYEGIDDLLSFYTDRTGNEPSYSIEPLPGKEETNYVDGSKKVGFSFAFNLVGPVADEAARIANQNFFEGFSEWLDEQTNKNNLPVLTGKYESLLIEATTFGYLFESDDSDINGHYLIQCKLTYKKEA